jgi:predicted TIM-barrel fold metal-dependent hydrolase
VNSVSATEVIIEPDLPIIDPHHHLWFLPEEFLAALERQESLMLQTLLPTFRRRARYPLGLSYDAWQLEYQLPDLIDLARAFPYTPIIVDHVGGLFGLGRYSGRTEERFARWRENIRSLSRCSNVSMKLGGLGIPFTYR